MATTKTTKRSRKAPVKARKAPAAAPKSKPKARKTVRRPRLKARKVTSIILSHNHNGPFRFVAGEAQVAKLKDPAGYLASGEVKLGSGQILPAIIRLDKAYRFQQVLIFTPKGGVVDLGDGWFQDDALRYGVKAKLFPFRWRLCLQRKWRSQGDKTVKPRKELVDATIEGAKPDTFGPGYEGIEKRRRRRRRKAA